MGYNTQLADRIREYLADIPGLEINEKKMFGGLAFIVDGSMCINVSGENLTCRFDPQLTEEIAERKGFMPMIMKGKELNGYCYISPEGFQSKKDFEFYINLCIAYNMKLHTGINNNRRSN